jgi:serine/threonine protein kinase
LYRYTTDDADDPGGGILLGLARLALGLEYMHHNKLLHRDVKAENILCCSSASDGGATADGLFPAPAQWKLADFGISRVLTTGGALCKLNSVDS